MSNNTREETLDKYIEELIDYIEKASEEKDGYLYALALLSIGVTAARKNNISEVEMIGAIIDTTK